MTSNSNIQLSTYTNFWITASEQTSMYNNAQKVVTLEGTDLFGRAIMEKFLLTELRGPCREDMRVSWIELMLNYPQFEKSAIITRNRNGLDSLFGNAYNRRRNAIIGEFPEVESRLKEFKIDEFERLIEYADLRDLLVENYKWRNSNRRVDPDMEWINGLDYLFIDLSYISDEQRTEFKSRLADRLYCKDKAGEWHTKIQFFVIA